MTDTTRTDAKRQKEEGEDKKIHWIHTQEPKRPPISRMQLHFPLRFTNPNSNLFRLLFISLKHYQTKSNYLEKSPANSIQAIFKFISYPVAFQIQQMDCVRWLLNYYQRHRNQAASCFSKAIVGNGMQAELGGVEAWKKGMQGIRSTFPPELRTYRQNMKSA